MFLLRIFAREIESDMYILTDSSDSTHTPKLKAINADSGTKVAVLLQCISTLTAGNYKLSSETKK